MQIETTRPPGTGPKYQLVMFDMDGTLADSFPWFLTVMNSIADKYGFRRIAPGDVETMRGLDSRRILDMLGVPLWKLPLIANHMRKLKHRHLDDIPLFAGVGEMLRELDARGITLAIVSSDAEANVRRALGDDARLIAHYGCGASLFGKAAKFRQVLRRAGVPASGTIAIGDELRDAEAARAAGIAFGAVAWGYARAEALQAAAPGYLFTSMDEIAAKLASTFNKDADPSSSPRLRTP